MNRNPSGLLFSQCIDGFPEKTRFYVPICCFYLSKAEKNHFQHPIL